MQICYNIGEIKEVSQFICAGRKNLRPHAARNFIEHCYFACEGTLNEGAPTEP